MFRNFPTAVMPPERLGKFFEDIECPWGTGHLFRILRQPRPRWSVSQLVGSFRTVRRQAVKTLMRVNGEIDIRGVLPAIHVPTLVMHRTGDRRVNVAAGHCLAEHIAGARYGGLSGNDHLFCAGDSQRILDQMAEFLTGSRAHSEMERSVATMLFTDIVGSTERALSLGDREWAIFWRGIR
jgi:pimeloyl-ACP methyl ester carboxylesterase